MRSLFFYRCINLTAVDVINPGWVQTTALIVCHVRKKQPHYFYPLFSFSRANRETHQTGVQLALAAPTRCSSSSLPHDQMSTLSIHPAMQPPTQPLSSPPLPYPPCLFPSFPPSPPLPSVSTPAASEPASATALRDAVEILQRGGSCGDRRDEGERARVTAIGFSSSQSAAAASAQAGL